MISLYLFLRAQLSSIEYASSVSAASATEKKLCGMNPTLPEERFFCAYLKAASSAVDLIAAVMSVVLSVELFVKLLVELLVVIVVVLETV